MLFCIYLLTKYQIEKVSWNPDCCAKVQWSEWFLYNKETIRPHGQDQVHKYKTRVDLAKNTLEPWVQVPKECEEVARNAWYCLRQTTVGSICRWWILARAWLGNQKNENKIQQRLLDPEDWKEHATRQGKQPAIVWSGLVRHPFLGPWNQKRPWKLYQPCNQLSYWKCVICRNIGYVK